MHINLVKNKIRMNLLHTVSVISLSTGAACTLIILFDILAGHAQKMWIMNIVWTVTALYADHLHYLPITQSEENLLLKKICQ